MKNKKTIIILSVVVFLAFFVRAYNFSDWLVFKADQARDAFYAKEAVEQGVSSLNLLGPKIEVVHIEGDSSSRGEPLKLGPFYFYQQYIIAKLTGGLEPWIFALGDMILSTLAIILFYFFARIYFSQKISFLVTILLAFSFYVIQYSRFAWNPNQLLFWELLFALGLYKSVFEENKKKAGWWLVAVIFSYAVMSQLHVVALFGFLPIAVIFWLIYRPRKINWKYWAAGTSLALLLYVPVVVSDIRNNGDNAKRFIAVLNKDRDENSFLKNSRKLVGRHGEISAVLLTSFHEREVKDIEYWGAMFFISSLLLLFVVIFKNQIFRGISSIAKVKQIGKIKEKIPDPDPFLILVMLWTLSFLVIFFKVVEDLNRARYFLAIVPVIFLFVGLWFLLIEKNLPEKLSWPITFLLFGIFLACNLWAIAFWYSSLARFESADNFNRAPKMNYYDELITLNSMKSALAYMVSEAEKDGKKICIHNCDYQYNVGFEYLKELYYPGVNMSRFSEKDLFNDCTFFIVARLKNGKEEIPEEFFENFEMTEMEKAGALNIWKVEYRGNIAEEVESEGVSSTDKEGEEDEERAILWKDVF